MIMGWLKIGDEWVLEMAGASSLTKDVYLKMALFSRNQRTAGVIEMMMMTLAVVAGETEAATWRCLLEMTKLWSSTGKRLVQIWVEETAETWREVCSGAFEETPNNKKVRVRFEMVCRQVAEMEFKKAEEAVRVRNFRRNKGKSERVRVRTCTNEDVQEPERTNADVRVRTACTGEKRGDEMRRDENNTPVVPKGTVFDQWFDEVFWTAYPRKVSKPQGKRAAKNAWKRVSADVIMEALARAKEEDHRFREREYTPHPASWLNSDPWGNEEGEGLESGEGRVASSDSGAGRSRGGVEKNQKSAGRGELLIGLPPEGAE